MKNTQKGMAPFLIALIIAVVLILIVGSVAYFYLQTNTSINTENNTVSQTNNEQNQNSNVPSSSNAQSNTVPNTVTPIPKNTAVANSQSNLKTYNTSISSGGFQFSYPTNFCITESTQNGTLAVTAAESKDCSPTTIDNTQIPMFSVSLDPKLVPTSVTSSAMENSIAQNYATAVSKLGDSVAKIENGVVGGQNAVRLLINHKPANFYAVFVIKNSRLYFINFSPSDSSVLAQILTSFKFK